MGARRSGMPVGEGTFQGSTCLAHALGPKRPWEHEVQPAVPIKPAGSGAMCPPGLASSCRAGSLSGSRSRPQLQAQAQAPAAPGVMFKAASVIREELVTCEE